MTIASRKYRVPFRYTGVAQSITEIKFIKGTRYQRRIWEKVYDPEFNYGEFATIKSGYC